ncbi:hypothetical protein V2J09_016235 [Rumex salicifolius]
MILHLMIFLLDLLIVSSASDSIINRRILHQPLFPSSSSPPPVLPPPPPPPDSSGGYSPDQPFFPEVPNGQSQTPAPPAPATTNGSEPITRATQPTNPTKKIAIVVSVGIVTLGMLCALSFYMYRHKRRKKHPVFEGRKSVGGEGNYSHSNGLVAGDSTAAPPSSFLYIGTVDHSNQSRPEIYSLPDGSPYHEPNPAKKSDRYRPSPDLQPLPPLSRGGRPSPPASNSTALYSSEDDEGSHDMAFYTPHGSIASTDDGFSTPVVSRQSSSNSKSKRTSRRSRLPPSSSPHDVIKHAIIPSIKAAPPPPRPPPLENKNEHTLPRRPKFGAPPPPPNLALLQSISNQSEHRPPTPPPPPPPPQLDSVAPKVRSTWTSFIPPPSQSPVSRTEKAKTSKEASSSRRAISDDTEGLKPKLKPLHWDKVRATSDRATVWDQLKSSSFELNEDRMESLFGSNSGNHEATKRSALPPVEQQYRILDPKKSQNIAILLRALNVTRDEVSEALLDGNPDTLGAELLETLAKMAPTKEEEIKLKGYKGDSSKLGSAERFLKAILDVPFAFKRVEAMQYRANFDSEVNYLRKSFRTLEDASRELRNSRLFLKLLEAVLTTGNRMNVGTNRGGAQSFKLDTLLKLVDIKGVDRKTTLLHFVVQEITRSEGNTESSSLANQATSKAKEEEFRRQGLQVVSGLSREIPNVKLAAGMDSDVLHNYVTKLEAGLEQLRTVVELEGKSGTEGRFFETMKVFVGRAEEEIRRVKEDERRALTLVREVTEYIHGDAGKEEAHPLRIFVIVRDFLLTLDSVCKDAVTMKERPVMGAARLSHAPLAVHNRYKITRNDTSSEESSSP